MIELLYLIPYILALILGTATSIQFLVHYPLRKIAPRAVVPVRRTVSPKLKHQERWVWTGTFLLHCLFPLFSLSEGAYAGTWHVSLYLALALLLFEAILFAWVQPRQEAVQRAANQEEPE